MTEQEITQARSDVDQLDIEQLRCGVLLQLLHIEQITKERDKLRLQIDVQAGSIEAVQAANQRLAANHKECVRCLGEALQDRADLAEAAKLALGALHAVLHDCDDIDMVESNEPGRDAGPWQLSNDAITALRQAGVQ